jgi:hypothetical protein
VSATLSVMSAVTHGTQLLDIRAGRKSATDVDRARVLRLISVEETWSLVRPDGDPVFEAHGRSGRQACLEYAFREGVLAIFT